jgi:DNA mismatch endonuclease (patch repair protein)
MRKAASPDRAQTAPPEDEPLVSATPRQASPPEPVRERPGAELGARMSRLSRRDTAPELALRRELHHRGLRYRLQVPVPTAPRRTIDIAFTRARVAVFVDGCFWHGCPEHGVRPETNRDWWRWKIERNQARDADTNERLQAAGWAVVRVWEHSVPAKAALAVAAVVTERLRGQGDAGVQAPRA